MLMGALDVLGLWSINKSFHAGVQIIQLGFFYSLPWGTSSTGATCLLCAGNAHRGTA
jgi:hypothetical protein